MKTTMMKAIAAASLLGAALLGGGGATATASGAVNAFEAVCNVVGGEVVVEGTASSYDFELSEDRPGCVRDKSLSSSITESKFWGVCTGMGYDGYTSPWYLAPDSSDVPDSIVYTCI